MINGVEMKKATTHEFLYSFLLENACFGGGGIAGGPDEEEGTQTNNE